MFKKMEQFWLLLFRPGIIYKSLSKTLKNELLNTFIKIKSLT